MNDVRKRLFELIDQTPNLDWLMLTKRPENIWKMWPRKRDAHPSRQHMQGEHCYRDNVWIGTTAENQEQANKRIPELLKCRDLSPVLFLSCEPLLGPIDLRSALWLEDQYFGLRNVYPHQKRPIDWVIVGGESGNEARPMHPQWARQLRDQCQAAGVAMHFKQWGEFGPAETALPKQIENAVYHVCERGERVFRVGKKAAGRLLDGREWNELPTGERIKS